MAKFEFRTIGSFDEIVGALDRAILDSALTMRLVDGRGREQTLRAALVCDAGREALP